MKARVTVGAYDVFGSGTGWARLQLQNGKRVKGDDSTKECIENGFIGFISREVNLYPKTKITYERGAYPGGSLKFEGTWEQLLLQEKFKLVKTF